jgi:HK97 gp10 family phage protein
VIVADISGLLRLAADFAQSAIEVVPAVGNEVGKTAKAIEQSGRKYTPVLTGELRDSWSTTVTGTAAETGPSAPHAPFPEYGTSTMAPQPYVGPAFNEHAPKLPDRIADVAEAHTLRRF